MPEYPLSQGFPDYDPHSVRHALKICLASSRAESLWEFKGRGVPDLDDGCGPFFRLRVSAEFAITLFGRLVLALGRSVFAQPQRGENVWYRIAIRVVRSLQMLRDGQSLVRNRGLPHSA